LEPPSHQDDAQLIARVYQELKAIARRERRRLPHSMQTTDLVHEAYARVHRKDSPAWNSKEHCVGTIAVAMRSFLIDRARKQQSIKGGGNVTFVGLTDALTIAHENPFTFLALNEAVSRLEEVEPEAAQVLMLRFFVGLTETDAANHLGISRSKATKLWRVAKTFLLSQLADDAFLESRRQKDPS